VLGARRVLDDATRVLCFNDEEYKGLQARVGARAVRMDHGVDVQKLSSGNGAAARGKLGLGDKPVVLQVGRLCAQKDQLLAVRAFAAGAPRDAVLVLAGAETDRGYRIAVESEARALGVSARVLLLGNVPAAEVPDLLAAATICLAPSVHEAFGLVALEAWAANKPMLFSRNGGLADLARALGASAPVVDSREPALWAAAIKALLGDAELRARAAAEGAQLVARRFSWDLAAARLAALYREVLDEGARGRAA
jgi:D-inositol-3-phosphate glycosyltransferase